MSILTDTLGTVASITSTALNAFYGVLQHLINGLIAFTFESAIPWAVQFGGEVAAQPLSSLHITVLALAFGLALLASDRLMEGVWMAIYRTGVYASFAAFGGVVLFLGMYLVTAAGA